MSSSPKGEQPQPPKRLSMLARVIVCFTVLIYASWFYEPAFTGGQILAYLAIAVVAALLWQIIGAAIYRLLKTKKASDSTP